MTFSAGSYVWIPDDEDVVLAAKVDTSFSPGSSGKVTLLAKGKTVKLQASATKTITQMHEQSLQSVDDMVDFKELDEFSILHNLRKRFEQDNIYTNIGRILTSVNPFQMLPIYTPELMDQYMELGSRKMPPHVYGVANDAFEAMIDNKKSQSCIVSGESGAGKTEATKVFLQFISEKSKRQSNSDDSGEGLEMQQKILESNPLMEAFGNAKTVRNDNSSRFGKWIEVQFERNSGSIVGGSIKSYLLEKSRIVNQANSERNYHIFYQLCAAAEVDPALADLKMGDATQYYYLNQSEQPCTVVESIDDNQEWQATLNAMEKIGITAEEKQEVLNILNVVLKTGNITFTKDKEDSAKVDNREALTTVAKLLGCTPEKLERSLVKVDRGNPADPDLVGNYDVGQSCDARDAFAKHTYSLLFNWLIAKINISLGRVKDSEKISTIGVLDIFGFEFFQNNSFEQLCINYCNEQLQGHFNNHIFKLEQEQYAKEGIDVTKIEFVDNGHVIRTIDFKGTGILQVIANELKLKNSTNLKLLGKLKAIADKVKDEGKKVITYPKSKEIKKNPELDSVFRVNHYAGQVSYRIEQFIEKNRDAVPSLLVKLGKACKNNFIRTLYDKGEASKKQALGIRFSRQLKDLMGDLNATEPHYIRCVKPNAEKLKIKFTAPMVLAQLRYAGLLEVCRIRQMGYPVRREHKEFYKRYRHLSEEPVKTHTDLVASLTKMGMIQDGHLQIGNTKVFLKTGLSDHLEEERAVSLAKWVQEIQRMVRGFLIRVVSSKWVNIRADLRDAIKARNKKLLEAAMLQYGSLPYGGKHLSEFKEAKELHNRITDEEKITKLLQDAMNSRDLNNILAAIKTAEEKELGKTALAKDAAMLVQLIERENACKQSLRDAIEKKDEPGLQTAVKLAKSLKLQDSTLCKDAEALLKAIDKERVCRKNLQEALNEKNVSRIKTFMNQMADMGRADDPLVKQGESIVKEKARVAAEIQDRQDNLMYALQQAITNKNLQALNDLETEVIDLGLDNDVVKEATRMRDQLQKEKDACAKLNAETIAATAKAQTRAGIVAKDLVSLEEAITEAEKILEPDDFQLLTAKDELHQLETQLKVQGDLEQTLKDYYEKKAIFAKEKDNGKRDVLEKEMINMLKNATETAVESGTETEAANEVKEKLNQIRLESEERHEGERAKKKAETKAKMQNATEDDKVEQDKKRMEVFTDVLSDAYAKQLEIAADTTRYDFSKYFRIRPDEDYVEKIKSDHKSNVAANKLRSQAKPIPKSLSRLDKKESDLAIRVNKAVLQYCGDLNNNFPATLAQFVMIKGMEDSAMANEVYLQLFKHINQNPKPDSMDKAWLLLTMVTKIFPPQEEFLPYALNFFITRKLHAGLIGNYARLCIVQLDATLQIGATWFKPSIEDIQNYRKRPPILATIHTLDGKKFDYPVTPDMRVTQVLDILKKKEGISTEEEDQPVWGIYVSPDEEQEKDDPKQRLMRFYQHYNPQKLAHVDLFLDHWKDNTEELFTKLSSKYGPEPTEDEKTKKKGMLALPITAAKTAVRFLGFASQKEQPPAPQTSWPLPWWTHLGDVYYRMAKQKKVPRFTFKRRLVTRKDPVDKWLYLQAVDDVRNGYFPVADANLMTRLAALSLAYEVGVKKIDSALSVPAMKGLGVNRYIPNSAMTDAKQTDNIIHNIIDLFTAKQIPDNKEQIMEAYMVLVRKIDVYGMNYFYARHSASDKNYVIAVDINGIHVLEEDRSAIKRSFVFDTIKKFGATAEYFWMNIDERQEPEKTGRFKFLTPTQGINVLLYTLQSWEMYDCVYDATHVGVEVDDDEDDEDYED